MKQMFKILRKQHAREYLKEYDKVSAETICNPVSPLRPQELEVRSLYHLRKISLCHYYAIRNDIVRFWF